MEVVASLSQGRTAAAQCGLFTHKSVPVIFEPPCNSGPPDSCRDTVPKMRQRCIFFYVLLSWDRASLMYSSKTNKMQRYITLFITIGALHVSGGSFTNHPELKTVYTASGIC